MRYVKDFDFFGDDIRQIPCLTGKGAPASGLAVEVGILYLDTDEGKLYKCPEVGVWKAEADGSTIAEDSEKLGGKDASEYALKTSLDGKLGKTEQAADSAKLGGTDADSYALRTDTAPNAEKLGGKPPEYYLTPVNLLDNSNLLEPVNQRGYANDTTVENTYFIDRWSVSGASSFSLGTNGMEIKSGFCHQIVSISQIKSGHAYTLACKMNGNILCYNGVAEETIGTWEDGLVTIYYAGQGVTIYLTKAGATYEWVALYEGAYTADTLPPYVPKPYAVELAECMRYAYPIGAESWLTGTHIAGHGLVLPLELSIPMRVLPTATGTYKAYVSGYGWADLTLNSIGYNWVTGRVHNLVFQPPAELPESDSCIITGIHGLFADL